MNNLKISVIMAVYNGERFLSEAIESILNQTLKGFEFIIINDCSTDSSLKIIEKYKEQDGKIVLINNEKNIGLTKSLNKGLKIARGKYIARMDADDVALPERFQKQYDYLEKNKDIFLVGTGAYNINEDGKIKNKTNPITDFKIVEKELYFKNCITHSTIMYRNEGNNFYREKFPYSQDYDFYLCLLSACKKLNNIPETLIKSRINPDAITWTKHAKQKLFAEKAKKFYHQRLECGKDEYDEFDPNEILNIDVEKSINKTVLESEIKASFKFNNFKKAREFCRKYFKYHGILNKIFVYYLFSFTGKKFVNLLRKIIF